MSNRIENKFIEWLKDSKRVMSVGVGIGKSNPTFNNELIKHLYNSKKISDQEYTKWLLSEKYYNPPLLSEEEGELEICWLKPTSYKITPTGLRCNCCDKRVVT